MLASLASISPRSGVPWQYAIATSSAVGARLFGRQATAWEIAYAVLFFLSEESVYVTAQALAVDSGLSGM